MSKSSKSYKKEAHKVIAHLGGGGGGKEVGKKSVGTRVNFGEVTPANVKILEVVNQAVFGEPTPFGDDFASSILAEPDHTRFSTDSSLTTPHIHTSHIRLQIHTSDYTHHTSDANNNNNNNSTHKTTQHNCLNSVPCMTDSYGLQFTTQTCLLDTYQATRSATWWPSLRRQCSPPTSG